VALEIEGSNPSVHPNKARPPAAYQESPLTSSSPRTPRRLISILFPVLLVIALAGGLLAASGCGGSSDDKAVSAIEKFLEVGQSPGTTNQILLDKLPPGLPEGLPEYSGSKLIGSTVTTGSAGKGLGVLRETADPVDQVYAFYEQSFSIAPWRVQMSTFPGKVAGVQFANTKDTSVSGAVVIQPSSDDDGASVIFLSIQSVSGSSTTEPFKLQPSKPLPMGWPEQIPVYPGATVTDTGWGQTGSSIEWQITFLAQITAQEVIDFYRTELTKAGFTVKDEAPQGATLMLSFQGAQTNETWSGAVSAQAFAQDPTYAQATVQLQIGVAVPQPSGTPAP
jgi:hypothetical protein